MVWHGRCHRISADDSACYGGVRGSGERRRAAPGGGGRGVAEACERGAA